jgi:hypothetical protein
MTSETADTVKSRKVGSEDTIVVKLPSERFQGVIPAHFNPPRDSRGCFRAMLVVQDCTQCSFGDAEAGPTQEVHLWVQLGSSPDEDPMEGVDLMLPSMQWVALAVATTNPEVEGRFRTFGFEPIRPARAGFHSGGGFLGFPDGDRLEWTIEGPGRGPVRIGVRHRLFLPGYGLEAVGNEVSAVVAGSMMGQPGTLRVHTASLEPFLLDGDRFRAHVHRMPRLKAEIVWHRWPKG